MNVRHQSSAFAGAVLVLVLCACATIPAGAPSPATAHAHYDGTVTVDVTARVVTADWRISFVPDSASGDSVTLLLNRGLQVSTVDGADVRSYDVKDSAGYNRITVQLKHAGSRRRPVGIDIAYSGVPRFGSDSINGIGAKWVELGLDAMWHPAFATFDKRITSTVRFTPPAGWDVVSSGAVTRRAAGVVITNTIPLSDVPFSAAPELLERSAGNTTVYHTGADSATVTRVLSTTAACASYLDTRYGTEERLPHAKIVLAPRTGPGYARKNYIVLSDVRAFPGEALDRYICHELAHFWSSGAVSTGPENWLNEALAEFVSARFVRERHGAAAYNTIVKQWDEVGRNQPPVWTPTITARPGPRVAYRKAPFILHQLEARVGSEVMERILARYMVGRLATTPAFLQVVSEVAGAEASEWLRGELAK